MWEEHLTEVEKVLIYLVAAGHCKYVSCLHQYLEAMIGLPTLVLHVLKAFKMDRYTYVKLSSMWCLERHDIREDIQP